MVRKQKGEKFMALNNVKFISRLSIRFKISLAIIVIFALVIGVLTTYNAMRESARMMELVQRESKDMTTMYFDSLNTMMLTGTMDQRNILNKKILSREGVLEARILRGEPVIKQYGPGLPGSAPVDDLDARALAGEEINEVRERNGKRILTVVTPFNATESTRGVNCLGCHNVQEGATNGAVRISFSLAEFDEAVRHEVWMSIGGGIVFFVAGLVLVNILLNSWLIGPLKSLVDVVNRRGSGDLGARVPVESEDELGKLASAFNRTSDIMDETTARENERIRREQAAAEELRAKVSDLLRVVNRVASGDFSAQVSFSGADAIGELAMQLQDMIDYIRKSSEEKKAAFEYLRTRVDVILEAVKKAAEGDLTGRVAIEGDDAIAQLGGGIQRMIDNLNGLVTQVQQSGIQVASAANAIATTAKEQEATVAEQAASTNEIVATATEISATSKELVTTMDEVSGVSERTAQSAESGRAELKRMETNMNHIVEAAGSISSKFEVINEKAGNINTVITTITKVADQTNLLSLNAAIEAEKAGEFGFGFSVVAREIRRLADQTAVATLDIEQMVKEMQGAVSAGVMSMERFTQQVRHSVDDVRQISAQLSHSIEQVQALTPLFESVHQGMQFQSDGASQINQSMIQLNEAAQQTVEALKESNEAIRQLNVAAHELQNGVCKFKTGDKG